MRRYLSELDGLLGVVFSPVVKWVLYLCFGVFLLQVFTPPDWIPLLFGASVGTTLQRLWLWQLFTYAFVHGSFGHVFFNLFAFWMFGRRLEQRWGTTTFVRFCLVVAAGAVATHLGVMAAVGQPQAVIIGLSGVVYGVLFAYAWYYPDEVVLFNFLIPMKVKYFVGILGVLTLTSSFQSSGSSVAHLTHLGGLLFGFLFVRFPGAFDWIPVERWPWRRRGPRRASGGRWRDL